jgi:hypothetical protein
VNPYRPKVIRKIWQFEGGESAHSSGGAAAAHGRGHGTDHSSHDKQLYDRHCNSNEDRVRSWWVELCHFWFASEISPQSKPERTPGET